MVLVTILVSVKNKVNTIKLCVESLLRLRYAPLAIMIIDNGSTDGSFEILKRYNDRIHLYQVKGNLSTALNWAIDRINTKYVALTDADCVVGEDWIDELLKGFDDKDVVAAAGYCGTPEGLNTFQKAIGLELEGRFKRFPQYILRAPTMNLCLRTDLAKQVIFNEDIGVGTETDFGYRLTKLGKMKFVPSAKVWHYHRPDICSYFKQNRDQAAGAVRTYLRHRDKIIGDHISTPMMMAQVPLGNIIIAGLFFGIWYKPAIYLTLISLSILMAIYVFSLFRITGQIRYYPCLLLIFFTRTFAWASGCIIGILRVLLRTK